MNPENQKSRYLKKRALSFKYAFKGIYTAIKTQPNVQIHLLLTIIVISMGFYFKIAHAEWILIIVAIALVFSAELFNSAIEELTDLVSPEKNKIAGRVKDIAAGAVLVCAIAAALIGLVIFLPKILGV